jgi:regulator of replication initiation timing
MKVIATKALPIDVVRIDGETQSRTKIHQNVVDEYAEKMADGIDFPAPVVFFDGKEYWLADGFHRYHATRKNKKASLACDVINGTVRDARFYSFGANATHGLPPSYEDKVQSANRMLADAEWGQRSDREIGRHCGLSHPTVGKLRAAMNPEKAKEPRVVKDRHGNDTKVKIQEPEWKETPPSIDPRDIEIERLKEQIEALSEENDRLNLELAIGSSDDPDFTKNTIEDLRAEVKQLSIENKSLTVSRDQFQAENAQLIKQVNFLTKKLKQVSPA